MTVTLHRFSHTPKPGDLDDEDLLILWGLMRAEGLADVFFHDGSVTTADAFVRYAANPATWFYAAKRGGEFIGIGVVNNFSSSGNTAYAHLASFACGRDGSFAEAGWLWFDLLHEAGGLDTLIALAPRCYRGVLAWLEDFGFKRALTLPRAAKLTRPGLRHGHGRVADLVVAVKDLRPGEAAQERAPQASDAAKDIRQEHSPETGNPIRLTPYA